VSTARRAIRLDIPSSVRVVSIPADVLADISDAPLNGSIEVEESEPKTLGEKRAGSALARSARADESNGGLKQSNSLLALV